MSPRALPASVNKDIQLQSNAANLLAYLNEKDGMGLLWDLRVADGLVVGPEGQWAYTYQEVQFLTHARTYYLILAKFISAVVCERGFILTKHRVMYKKDWDAAKKTVKLPYTQNLVNDGIRPENRLPTMNQGNVINNAVIGVELEYQKEVLDKEDP